jgi:hypothetical protein
MQAQSLHKAAQSLADLLSITRDPWWIFGGAAMALLGLETEEVKDIDVLVSAADGDILAKAYGLINYADSGHSRFRSLWFAKLILADMPVEIFADFQVKRGEGWQNIVPLTRHEVRVGAANLFVPEPIELADIFQACGRPKDLVRAERLGRLWLIKT